MRSVSADLSDYLLIAESDKRPSSLIKNSGSMRAPCFIAFSNSDLMNQFGFFNPCFAVGMHNFVDFGSCSNLEISQTVLISKKPIATF